MIRTLYLVSQAVSLEQLPPLAEQDALVLLGEGVYGWPLLPSTLPVFAMKEDLLARGLTAHHPESAIDHHQLVRLVTEYERCITW